MKSSHWLGPVICFFHSALSLKLLLGDIRFIKTCGTFPICSVPDQVKEQEAQLLQRDHMTRYVRAVFHEEWK